SGHATIGSALFRTLADFYGTDDIAFTITSDEFNTITIDQNGQPRPLVPWSYTSFSEAAAENAQSRIYLGVHFHFDMIAGMNAGNTIGGMVISSIGQRALNENRAFINKVYQDTLHRAADAGGLANWEAQLNQG